MSGTALAWVGLYPLLVVAPLAALLLAPVPPGRGFWWDFSTALGFAGLAMIGVQFALTARFKRASAPFGIDVLYLLHRYLAIIALLLALGHFGILGMRYEDALGALDPREAPWELTAGRAALVPFALAVVTPQWRKELRLEHGLWRHAHVALATLGFATAVAHVVGIGHYTATPAKLALWLSATLFRVLLLAWVRIVKPWRQTLRPWRVAEARPERGGTWTLALEPDGHPGLRRFRPGQFAWLTLGRSPFGLREHPFSIASPPEEDWTGETGLVRREVLERHLPRHPGRRAALRCFLCGPAPMTAAEDEALRGLGVPAHHIQTEIFELAWRGIPHARPHRLPARRAHPRPRGAVGPGLRAAAKVTPAWREPRRPGRIAPGEAELGTARRPGRRRMGIEPTTRCQRVDGFEDRGGHQTPVASGRVNPAGRARVPRQRSAGRPTAG